MSALRIHRRNVLVAVIVVFSLTLAGVALYRSKPLQLEDQQDEQRGWAAVANTLLNKRRQNSDDTTNGNSNRNSDDDDGKEDASIMAPMGNQTLRAELGRAGWTTLHVMAARFPEEPSQDEQDAFVAYIHLFGMLYPCGDCAREFRKLVQAHPPSVGSRDQAMQWFCEIHNHVNVRLNKPIFPCEKVRDRWQCGCVDEV
ncbi:FAD dependent sulfhydryl oxidase Erv2 [Capsaspora owczarzaki ATCC 30864]|uniref:Sulfhydryl oxidase n=1 Tax=Capsaspora owczarzaki (strain ATCC 30864) TaxID=595528 RepID=A0A0D2X5H0_CAPO3|nr:FAD dependent sulfhydryl oxidase Erv2 [Capsaspora owczarzaki ATCC 30864]KJE97794.1 FAD dependent sulfhydryl oxidase Erv2 [Capsaspora owczarzaki ATCC 30864]|eukprot:XP_004342977.1 FAD dependent sulfhydryl oxidase Erv2 [Capsaspora owczarzaki ATCC 30864]